MSTSQFSENVNVQDTLAFIEYFKSCYLREIEDIKGVAVTLNDETGEYNELDDDERVPKILDCLFKREFTQLTKYTDIDREFIGGAIEFTCRVSEDKVYTYNILVEDDLSANRWNQNDDSCKLEITITITMS